MGGVGSRYLSGRNCVAPPTLYEAATLRVVILRGLSFARETKPFLVAGFTLCVCVLSLVHLPVWEPARVKHTPRSVSLRSEEGEHESMLASVAPQKMTANTTECDTQFCIPSRNPYRLHTIMRQGQPYTRRMYCKDAGALDRLHFTTAMHTNTSAPDITHIAVAPSLACFCVASTFAKIMVTESRLARSDLACVHLRTRMCGARVLSGMLQKWAARQLARAFWRLGVRWKFVFWLQYSVVVSSVRVCVCSRVRSKYVMGMSTKR